MKDLLLHDQTNLYLQALLNDPPHALLVTGVNGIGKYSIAVEWGKQITPHVESVQPDEKGTISIDTVRELYRRTRSKRTEHQVIIIDHAEAMGTDAQNAFLKLLEEPRQGVTFVLTAPSQDSLLPTIISRMQSIQINAMPASKLQAWAKQVKPGVNDQELAQALFVAQGRPATLKAMLTEEGDFEKRKQIMQTAKQLLSATKYERLSQVNNLVKDRLELISTLEAMSHMVKLQLQKGATANLIRLADGLQDCLARLAQNANPRAQLLRLFVLY